MEENVSNIVVVDAARGTVLSAVLASGGPEIGLKIKTINGGYSMSKCGRRTYMVYQRIGCDIVITGQFGQSKALTAFNRRRSIARFPWGHNGRG